MESSARTTSSSPSANAALSREWVAIRMDDKVFRLMRSTIHRGAPGSLLAAMFPESCDDDGDGADCGNALGIPLFVDETHPLRPVVFDRSPEHFAPIVNFIRTGELIIGPTVAPRGVLHEALYFGVDAVAQQLAHLEPDDFGAPRPPTDETSYSRRDIEALVTAGRVERLVGLNFCGADFSGLDLTKARFRRCNLRRANFSNALLLDASLEGCDVSDASFESAKLNRVLMHGCVCERTKFDRAALVGARCGENNFSEASLREAQCHSSSFSRSMMVKVDATRCVFQSADLSECNMSCATLTGADFSQATMRRAILNGVDREGVNLSMGGVLH